MKYNEAYCRFFNEILTIDDVTLIYNTDKNQFAKQLDGQMFCPCCKAVRFAYVTPANIHPFFRGYPNEEHAATCEFHKEEMTPEEVSLLQKSGAGKDQILQQMRRILIDHLKTCEQHEQRVNGNKGTKAMPSIAFPKSNRVSSKLVPRKLLTAPFTPGDYDTEKIFYGRVLLSYEENESSNKGKLLIYHPHSKRMICKIILTANVKSHIPEPWKVLKKREIFIVFFSKLSVPNHQSGQKWSIGTLPSSKMIQVEFL